MINCTFELNDKPMSTFTVGALSVAAFSGLGADVNRRASMCRYGNGPIPVGQYYIFDRPSGGLIGPLREMLGGGADKSQWFSLYAIDDHIDNDSMLCHEIVRGQFRLHPKGTLGRSEGCITIDDIRDWLTVHAALRNTTPVSVPGSALKAYGIVVVK